jgi:biopolymer transport protein ExbD
MLALPHIPRPASFRHRLITTPQGMDIMASVMLLLVMFYMSGSKPVSIFAEPSVQLASSTSECRCPEVHSIIVSVDAKNRVYVAADDEKVQTAMIRQVARQHHVRLTVLQLLRLPDILFLSTDIQELPAWLSASVRERQLMTTGISTAADNNQLGEYINAGMAICRAKFGKPAYLVLRMDKRLLAPQAMRIFQLLQDQGIHRFNLAAELEVVPPHRSLAHF